MSWTVGILFLFESGIGVLCCFWAYERGMNRQHQAFDYVLLARAVKRELADTIIEAHHGEYEARIQDLHAQLASYRMKATPKKTKKGGK